MHADNAFAQPSWNARPSQNRPDYRHCRARRHRRGDPVGRTKDENIFYIAGYLTAIRHLACASAGRADFEAEIVAAGERAPPALHVCLHYRAASGRPMTT
jgi:hypothetical protein